MESLLFTIVSFVVALAILIAVHELGHFWVARRLGVKVLRFSLGFGQPLWKRVSPKDGTEYVVAAIPLGGYVKMLDEREAPVPPEQLPLAFNRQPLWRRSAIVVAGPLFNFLFAILAYWLVLVSGDVGLRPLIGEVEPESVAERAGFRPGDEILAIGERTTPSWESAVYALMAEYLEGRDLAVRVREPDGSEAMHWLASEDLVRLADDPNILGTLGLSPRRPEVPPVIGKLVPGDPAQRAGLRPGDLLVSADGQPLAGWRQWVDYVRERAGQTIRLQVRRDGQILELDLTPKAVADGERSIGRIGASVQIPEGLYDSYRVIVRLGPLEALGGSLDKAADLSLLMLKVIGRMLTGQASIENLSGPISIAESAGKSASFGWTHFLKFLAVVSISLGVLNLLPIPVLDGGHLFFFLLEAIKGSPLSEEFLVQGQRIGVALLLALMTLAFYVDISRLLG
jgi:regulator of sigma E protease